MICYWFEEPTYFFFANDVPALLYYSHIPTVIIALSIGFFVLLGNRKALPNKLLFFISILFSFWTVTNLILWTNIHSDFLAFIWTLEISLRGFIAVFLVYFVITFLTKKDASFREKSIFALLLAPILLFGASNANISGFDIANCDAFIYESYPYRIYCTAVALISMTWILGLLIKHYKHAGASFKKQILILGIGVELFLLTFFFLETLASYLTLIGIFQDSRLELYGLFGMTFFMAMIAVLIVQYQAFSVKLIATRALVFGIGVLIASQFFFIQAWQNYILTALTLGLAIFGGWALIRSVKEEIKRKEELERLTKKLKKVNARLKEMDRTKSEFVSIASHQLRTPLTAIKGFISLIMEGSYGKIDVPVRNALNKVYLSNERLIQLVEDLLSISRIEAGRLEYQFHNCNVMDMVHDVADMFRLRANEAGLRLDVDIADNTDMHAVIDESKIREVLSNLLDNAIKYTKQGFVRVYVEKYDDKVCIMISDSGIGIPEDDIPCLFEKFSRGKDTNRLHANGSGLGLYVGKQIVRAHGGNIRVLSEGVGKGSTFIIELPIQGKKEVPPTRTSETD
jgi:signal transduction histidine kinase